MGRSRVRGQPDDEGHGIDEAGGMVLDQVQAEVVEQVELVVAMPVAAGAGGSTTRAAAPSVAADAGRADGGGYRGHRSHKLPSTGGSPRGARPPDAERRAPASKLPAGGQEDKKKRRTPGEPARTGFPADTGPRPGYHGADPRTPTPAEKRRAPER
jgi:hypothetical protein